MIVTDPEHGARHLAGNVSHTTGQNRKRNKPSAQLGAPTKEVLDIMNKIKPRHPRSLTTEHATQGSKRKATESEGDGLGQVPDPSRSSQPNVEKEEKKQRVIDGRRAALGFLVAGFQLVVQTLHQLILCSGCDYLHASLHVAQHAFSLVRRRRRRHQVLHMD